MSDHRQVAVKDRRAEPTGPGRRAARRAGGDDRPPPEEPPVSRRSSRSPRRGGLGLSRWIGIGVTGLLVLGTLGGYKVYHDIEGEFKKLNIDDELGKNRPPETGALNVLIVGSDTREGAGNKRYGQHMQGLGERTDTIMLLHISPDRDKATLISFPRDSVVQVPECRSPQTKAVIPPGPRMINATFNEGGIACTWKTIESLTQIHIDHFVKVDFSGFKNIVDALGGVPICVSKDVVDKKAKLELKAGNHVVKGETALAYVRARYSMGDGSDLSRIKRQQVFLNQVMKKATSSDLLTDPIKLNSFLKAAAGSLTMDSHLNVNRMLEIAQSAKKLTAKGLQAITVPWMPDPADKNRVVWRPEAANLFEAIRADTEVTQPDKASTKPAVKNEQVRIQVLNGTGRPGVAGEAAAKLADQGFVVVQTGNAGPATGVPTTSVRYAKAETEGAAYGDALALRLSGDKLTPVAGKMRPTNVQNYAPTIPVTTPPKGPIIQLVIGNDWKGVRVPTKIPDSLKGNVVDSKTDPCQ
ncbi:LCP family protein [Streptosporangium sandarakinum]|uniref:LCP family protein required for cell wall assembly n=1 Tax=Streptosporangium sandarakinum TaxID=1260955 RepID=A0A852V212_9ACTN|nr:LCP family protein [Streptosporangium sandarakinum]NYF39865.1 LCP family protein required for cell wall assembly [Streptosporangium sandarakinum]